MGADPLLSTSPGSLRVLCVDDDRINAMLLGELCRQFDGVELAFAETGEEACALAAEFQPQLFVVDLHLPDTDGLRLLPRLREVAGPAVPAVLCTAELPEDVLPRAEAAGFDACWGKPVPPEQLASTIDHLRHGRRP